MNLLYLSSWFPFPPTNGSELRINALIRGLAARHDVTLLSFRRRPIDPRGLAQARAILSDVRLVPWREFAPDSRRARLGFLSSQPRSVVDTYSTEMDMLIREVIAMHQYDAVVVSQLAMAAYWPAWGDLPTVLDEVELGSSREQSRLASTPMARVRRTLMWAKLQSYVRGLLPHFDAVTVVSQRERDLLRQVAPDYSAVSLVPNGIDSAACASVRAGHDPDTLIFTGAFTYDVNHEAMVWFLDEVYPIIRQNVPQLRLTITGDHAGKPLPSADGVTLTGFVDDVRPLIAGAGAAVVPIRQGGGTRLKILEAMAVGTPVVATSKGAEGLDVTDGENILLADTPQDFAEAILRLRQDAALCQNLVNNACLLIRRQYDWVVILPDFIELVERVASRAMTPVQQ